jgi:hypothetical protein
MEISGQSVRLGHKMTDVKVEMVIISKACSLRLEEL